MALICTGYETIPFISSIPLINLIQVIILYLVQEYPKLSSSYYSLMDVVTQDHLTLLGSVDANVIVYILSTLAEGIASVGMFYFHIL